MKTSGEKCKHKKAWIIAGGSIEWCHGCGAFRNLQHIPYKNASRVISPWCRPGESHEKFHSRCLDYMKRYVK